MDTPQTADVPMKWEVSDEYPHGHAVPFTPDELHQHDLDLAVAAAFAALPPPPDPVAEIVNIVVDSPDYAAVQKNLAAYLLTRGGDDGFGRIR